MKKSQSIISLLLSNSIVSFRFKQKIIIIVSYVYMPSDNKLLVDHYRNLMANMYILSPDR